ncbi:MAG: hypothetical protein JRN68_08110 [Nitrososphaerota archaeon]|nr:hypothetical protein [Nitrososphaerota archaeon]
MRRLDLKENPVLERKEASYLFEDSAGKLTRIDAIKAVAGDLNVPEESVVLFSLRGRHGTRDQVASFHVYTDKSAKSQVPRYVIMRNLPKEERKKIIEEEKKKKAPKVATQKK